MPVYGKPPERTVSRIRVVRPGTCKRSHAASVGFRSANARKTANGVISESAQGKENVRPEKPRLIRNHVVSAVKGPENAGPNVVGESGASGSQ